MIHFVHYMQVIVDWSLYTGSDIYTWISLGCYRYVGMVKRMIGYIVVYCYAHPHEFDQRARRYIIIFIIDIQTLQGSKQFMLAASVYKHMANMSAVDTFIHLPNIHTYIYVYMRTRVLLLSRYM